MQSDAGLKPLELLASIEGERYEFGSPRLLLIAEKA